MIGKLLCFFGRCEWVRDDDWPKLLRYPWATIVVGPCRRCGKGKAICNMRQPAFRHEPEVFEKEIEPDRSSEIVTCPACDGLGAVGLVWLSTCAICHGTKMIARRDAEAYLNPKEIE